VRSEASAASTAARVALCKRVLGVCGQSGVPGGVLIMFALLERGWRLGIKGRADTVSFEGVTVGGLPIGVVGYVDLIEELIAVEVTMFMSGSFGLLGYPRVFELSVFILFMFISDSGVHFVLGIAGDHDVLSDFASVGADGGNGDGDGDGATFILLFLKVLLK